MFNLEDSNNYIAKMMRGTYGDWLFRTPYTAPGQEGVLAYSFYILLGKLASPPEVHIQLVMLFHLARFGAGVLAIGAMYGFVSVFIEDLRLRRFAITLITIGGGVGCLAVFISGNTILGSPPLELFSPETFSFLMLFGLPHLCMARALLFWGLTIYHREILGFEGIRWMPTLRVGFLWLLMGLIQPIMVVLGWALVGSHWAVTMLISFLTRKIDFASIWIQARTALANLIVIGLVSSPIVVYIMTLYAVPNLGPEWFYHVWGEQVKVPFSSSDTLLVSLWFILITDIVFFLKESI